MIFHTDATQWVGKMPTDVVNDDNIDLLSCSAVIRCTVRRVSARCTSAGAGRASGWSRRSKAAVRNAATVPARSTVQRDRRLSAMACELCAKEMEQDQQRLLKLRTKLETQLQAKLQHVQVNGHADRRLPHLTNISFGFVEGEGLMMAIKDLACSSGSACTSASLEPSYVLKALGIGDDLAHSSLRLSLGRINTEEQIDFAIEKITWAVNHLRDLSPLWDMHQEGIDINTIEWANH